VENACTHSEGHKAYRKQNDVNFITIGWVGKPQVNKPLEMPRHRWEDDIKMYLGVI
jgi:hypothetical protein